MERRRPTKEELEAARRKTIPDVLGPGMRVLFVGINPGLYSGAVGHHFARPGNRFWKTLHGAGIWVLPNPSGRTAAYQLPQLVAAFSELRAFLDGPSVTGSGA